MKNNFGFTLIELMIVVAIIAILASLLLPSYTEQVRKTRRSTVVSNLAQVALTQEKFRADNPTYNNNATTIGLTTMDTADTFYTYALSNVAATGYVVTATPAGSQAGDRCGNISLTILNGVGKPTPASGSKCF